MCRTWDLGRHHSGPCGHRIQADKHIAGSTDLEGRETLESHVTTILIADFRGNDNTTKSFRQIAVEIGEEQHQQEGTIRVVNGIPYPLSPELAHTCSGSISSNDKNVMKTGGRGRSRD